MTAISSGRAFVGRARQWDGLADALAIAWIVLFVFLYLSPALKDGINFGPADLARGLSRLTALGPGAPPNHNVVNGDILTQDVPWNTLDWQLVHSGHFPFWNDLSGTGLPQFLNFESAVLALPTLVGYLAPLSASFLVTVAMKLLIAGTGTYVCSRLLGARPLAAAFGGTTFMLAGAFSGWLGWAVSGPFAWCGWILAGIILCYRSRHRARDVVLLALACAFCIYAGFPESYVLMAIGLGVLLVACGLATVALRRRVEPVGLLRVAAGIVAGAGLSAPLWLPGLSVLKASARNGKNAASGIPLHAVLNILAQGYYGLPIRGSTFFGSFNYFETAAYVGVIALVLAAAATIVLFRRPVVAGLAVASLACLLVVYDLGSGAPVQHLLSRLGLSAVALQRAQSVLEFLVAVLAALGLELAIARWHERRVGLSLFGSAVAVLVVLAAMWARVSTAVAPPTLVAEDQAAHQPVPSPATLQALRRASLLWPTATILALVALLVVAHLASRRLDAAAIRRAGALAAGGLLAVQSAFLLFAGVGINSYSDDAFPVTPAVAKLQSIVGASLVGIDGGNTTCTAAGATCGVRQWTGFGFYPLVNLGYGIDELGMHDPTIPQAYFDAWPVPNADQTYAGNLNLFVPAVDSLALAQRYGVSYVVAYPGAKLPAGMSLVTTLATPYGDEQLWRVPGAARFSFSGSGGDRVTGVAHPGDAAYRLSVVAPAPAELVLRITDVPGWHVVVSGPHLAGRSLTVRGADGGAFLAVSVPAGTTTITASYWPKHFDLSLALAGAAALALAAWIAYETFRRRRGDVADVASGGGEEHRETGRPLVPSVGG